MQPSDMTDLQFCMITADPAYNPVCYILIPHSEFVSNLET